MNLLINDGHWVNWAVRENWTTSPWTEHKFSVLVTWAEPDPSEWLLPGQYFILAADQEGQEGQTSP